MMLFNKKIENLFAMFDLEDEKRCLAKFNGKPMFKIKQNSQVWRRENALQNKDRVEKRYVSMQDEIQSLKSTLKSVHSQTSGMMEIINMLREEIMTLKKTHRNPENNESELREWIENKVKLPQYLDLMIENGFEDLESLQDITMEHLREMGIDKIGHRIKLMKAVATLQGIHKGPHLRQSSTVNS